MSGSLVTPDLSHLSLNDYENVYEPAEDSFLFLDALEEDMRTLKKLSPTVCLEVGSGSGVVSTSIAKYFGSSCYMLASDINPFACNVTLKTSDSNGTHVDAVRADLVSELRKEGLVDLLLFNPPYVVTPSEEISLSSYTTELHRSWAGGKRGREVMDRLISEVKFLLAARALFYLVVIDENDPKEIAEKMNGLGFDSCIVKSRKVRGERLSVMRFARGLDR